MTQKVVDYCFPQDLEGTMLERIMRDRLHEIVGAKLKWPASAIEMALDRAPEVRSLKKALLRRSPAIIAEIKRASPSAGILRADFNPVTIAQGYEEAGAAAISVVTENKYFQGGLEIIPSLRWMSGLPLLRKDFIVDRYQILEARHAGADAVLLIVALLDTHALERLRVEAEKLGMEVLVEVHSDNELERALEAGSTLIGVNNRDLRTFEVSLDVSLKLAPLVPKQVAAISESGIRSAEDIGRLTAAGYRGFLIGESLLRAASPSKALADLISTPAAGKRKAS